MSIRAKIKKNTYLDSISLMSISTQANNIEHVKQAMIGMGTDMNKEVIENVGMTVDEIKKATTGDLIIVIQTDKEDQLDAAMEEVEKLFIRKEDKSETKEKTYNSISSAVEDVDSNIAVISVNGLYAAREAREALNNDLHVMLFSDNVSIEDEVELKKLAHEKGLLMMGPDCGTAIINNTGLCFANKVRKGNIGIVGASGTGSQELSVRIHDFGYGISQLIGTGGRDLSKEVNGIMMVDGIRALEEAPDTEVIVLISKPPEKEVEKKVLKEVNKSKKPVVIWFLGGDEESIQASKGHYAKGSKEAAIKAVVLAGADEDSLNKHSLNLPLIKEVQKKLKPEQKYIRGLFTGGTLCDEAMLAAKEYYEDMYSNISKDEKYQLEDSGKSFHHTFIDFGSDEYTDGKPHPMIDPSARIDRFMEEAADPKVGVILLDFVLGYGSHEDPVGAMVPAIKEAKEKAKAEGRHLEIIGYVLGTDEDRQNLKAQNDKLDSLGVTLSSSSQNLGLLARGFVNKEENNG
ncbi:MAG: acyl-CoA synthetase FdrA [Alkalibacterium gilvum]|uniref:Succinyl-CoA synthetase, alpha subunit n=1 Tax=Alkalibacterium gilvum TaxID=1130080 RepID=A0A1H6UAH7_9LACT|nr:acyl-CoA synthetase FdrA [Alkalibacterium gilvum]MDN6729810.1 acyl-CoA synthetase FdrA [Alkalibacterium sp.]SEI88556.1 Succinyl-CoA synthetase, alpha subunit [Alkalibacterium gilvum]